MLKCKRLARVSLGAFAVALIGLPWGAQADCDATGNPTGGTPCYVLKGSDTLFDIVTTAINNARGVTTGTVGASAKKLYYYGSGSGNAEAAMKASTNADLGVQSIGPMSRNMRPSIIDSGAAGYVAGGPGLGTTCSPPTGGTDNKACGHAVWAPGVSNVVGLDAAVFLVRNSSTVLFSDLQFTTFVDPAGPTTIKKASLNNTALPSAYGTSSISNALNTSCTACGQAGQPACPAACANYNNLMSIVLSGTDGSGTMAACSDPRRIQAVQDIAGLLGTPTINHIFRRDDNSGTTDTFKDRIMVVASGNAEKATYPNTGGRFCNGQAFGNINGSTLQKGLCSTSRAVCTLSSDCAASGAGQVCQYNLNNQDFDPVRRPCSPVTASAAPTTCTDWTTGIACKATDGNPNCTQGLIVALTDYDPGATDITNSIGKRVGTSDGSIMGYAGREAANGTGAKGLFINGIAPADDNVRNSSYLLARRLFIQNPYANGTAAADKSTDGQNTATGWTVNGVTGGGTAQVTAEQDLWTNYLSNRALMDPVVRQYGFIRCSYTGDGNDPSLESNNLCGLLPSPAVTAPLGGFIPSGAATGGAGTAAAISIDHRGREYYQANGTVPAVLAPAGGATGKLCVSGANSSATARVCINGPNTGITTCAVDADCGTGAPAGSCAFQCPDLTPQPANAPCTVNADCSGTLICSDPLGQSASGQGYNLYCCDPAGGNPLCVAHPH